MPTDDTSFANDLESMSNLLGEFAPQDLDGEYMEAAKRVASIDLNRSGTAGIQECVEILENLNLPPAKENSTKVTTPHAGSLTASQQQQIEDVIRQAMNERRSKIAVSSPAGNTKRKATRRGRRQMI